MASILGNPCRASLNGVSESSIARDIGTRVIGANITLETLRIAGHTLIGWHAIGRLHNEEVWPI